MRPARKRGAGLTVFAAVICIFCDACGALRAKARFGDDEKQRWKGDAQKGFTCRRCGGQQKATERRERLTRGRHWLLSAFDGEEQLKFVGHSSVANMS